MSKSGRTCRLWLSCCKSEPSLEVFQLVDLCTSIQGPVPVQLDQTCFLSASFSRQQPAANFQDNASWYTQWNQLCHAQILQGAFCLLSSPEEIIRTCKHLKCQKIFMDLVHNAMWTMKRNFRLIETYLHLVLRCWYSILNLEIKGSRLSVNKTLPVLRS